MNYIGRSKLVQVQEISARQVLHLAVGAIIAFGTVFGLPSSAAQRQIGCHSKLLETVKSPDGASAAFLLQEVCSNGSFITTVNDIVEMRIREGEKSRVLAVSTSGNDDDHPKLLWISNTKFHIIVDNRALIGLRRPNFEGVEINLLFNPGDAAQRQQFLKSLGVKEE
jgi:hypothetical protein